MKKLLGIIVLSLLLSGNAYAFVSKNLQQQYIDSGLIKVGMKMSDFYPIVKSIDAVAFVPNYKKGGKYLFLLTGYTTNTQVYLGEATNSNPKKNKSAWGTMIGWKLDKYKLIKIYDDPIVAFDYLISLEKNPKELKRVVKLKASYIKYNQEPTKTTQSNTASSSSSSSNISTKDKITQSKQICTDLGFKVNTEKFADCALQMMSIQFQTTNKVASASGGTTQEIIVKHQNDYDIFDAMIDVSNAMLSNNKKSSSSSSNNNTRCVIGRTNPTFGTTTMNCN